MKARISTKEKTTADPSLEDLDDIYGEVDDAWAVTVNAGIILEEEDIEEKEQGEEENEESMKLKLKISKGGEGSGFKGHAGRAGKVGGSAPMGGVGASPEEHARKLRHAAQNRQFVKAVTGTSASGNVQAQVETFARMHNEASDE